MDIAMISVVFTFWLTSTVYVMRWHYKNGETAFGVVLVALLLGPILVFFIKDSEKEKEYNQTTSDFKSHHIRWFRTMDEINRQRTSTWFRSIPPPPPLSRVERARSERDRTIRTARERINKIKDFKFFH
jgi:DNA repair photolyase